MVTITENNAPKVKRISFFFQGNLTRLYWRSDKSRKYLLLDINCSGFFDRY